MLPTKEEIHLPGLLDEIENIATLTPHITINVFTARAVNAITNYMISYHKKTDPFKKKLKKTMIFLKNHDELLVTRSDKGNVTVPMKNSDYKKLVRNF